MAVKSFRIDWYFKDALEDFSELEASEIGVLMQIINLIYAKGRPIPNDPQFIGRRCNIQRHKAERIIKALLEKNKIYLTVDGNISQKRCEIELLELQERRRISAESGKLGAENRWKNLRNQGVDNGVLKLSPMASTSLSVDRSTNFSFSTEKPPIPPVDDKKPSQRRNGHDYDIADYLEPATIKTLREAIPKIIPERAIDAYNEAIASGEHNISENPKYDFVKWCKDRVADVQK